MNLPNRIFFTGVPGSKWSSIAQTIETLPGMNTTDRTPEREYNHNQYSGHKGAYFGYGMEFEANLSYVDQAWSEPNAGCKLVKSHEWAYQLNNIPGDWIMLVYRPELVSNAWWHEAGGFNITYPNYEYYIDSATMLYEIQKQNAAILEFAYDKNLTWHRFTNMWIYEQFGEMVPGVQCMKDVLVTIYKP
jgi:hypothetical protein